MKKKTCKMMGFADRSIAIRAQDVAADVAAFALGTE